MSSEIVWNHQRLGGGPRMMSYEIIMTSSEIDHDFKQAPKVMPHEIIMTSSKIIWWLWWTPKIVPHEIIMTSSKIVYDFGAASEWWHMKSSWHRLKSYMTLGGVQNDATWNRYEIVLNRIWHWQAPMSCHMKSYVNRNHVVPIMLFITFPYQNRL